MKESHGVPTGERREFLVDAAEEALDDWLRPYGRNDDSPHDLVLNTSATAVLEALADAGLLDHLPGAPPADPVRGENVTAALTEIRTVLSRAETALSTLAGPYGGQIIGFTRERGKYEQVFVEDPDVLDMVGALRQVIGVLSRWRRTGRPVKHLAEMVCLDTDPHAVYPGGKRWQIRVDDSETVLEIQGNDSETVHEEAQLALGRAGWKKAGNTGWSHQHGGVWTSKVERMWPE